MLKILSCAGFGNTGSSIVTDFFSEFSCIKVVGGSSFEFGLLHEPDGIRDLENALVEGNRLKTDLAIKRFIKLVKNLNENNPSGPNYRDYFNNHFLEYTQDYLRDLNVIRWSNGWWHRIYDEVDRKGIKEKIRFKVDSFNFSKKVNSKNYSLYETNSWKPSYVEYDTQYFCKVEKADFKNKTKKYLQRLFLELANGDEYLLFDQLFPSNVDEEYLGYFDFAKVILVDRDPADLYFMNKVFWGSGYIPSEDVNTFIQWYKETRSNVYRSDNILKINFEDMIFKTDETQRLLCDFIGIDIAQHDMPNTYLFLDKSITNTQVDKRNCLTSKVNAEKIDSDLQLIRQELKKYLYLFPNLIISDNEKKYQEMIIENVYSEVKQKKWSDVFVCIYVIFRSLLIKIIRR